MGLVETEAIVLRTYKLSEADKITVCLTRKAGLVRGVARGARRLKSRFGASLEPFTQVQLTFYEKEGRELVTIKQAEILRSHFDWAASSEALPFLTHFGELATEFSPPNQADERLYRMVRSCLDASAACPEAVPYISVYFELWMLKLSGFLPDLRRCGSCGRRLSPGAGRLRASFEGVLRCEDCAGEGDNPLDPKAYGHLYAMNAKGPGPWAEEFRRAGREAQQRLWEFARRLLRRALEKDLRGSKSPSAAAWPDTLESFEGLRGAR